MKSPHQELTEGLGNARLEGQRWVPAKRRLQMPPSIGFICALAVAFAMGVVAGLLLP